MASKDRAANTAQLCTPVRLEQHRQTCVTGVKDLPVECVDLKQADQHSGTIPLSDKVDVVIKMPAESCTRQLPVRSPALIHCL